MNHFLITRFNLKKLFSHDKNNQSVQTDDWTRRRFALFERYCLPSVLAQTNKNFKWICLFSNDTSQEYREMIESYQAVVPQFIPQFFDDTQMIHFREELLYSIKRLSTETGCVITTRLDNDDTIHKDFIRNIQEHAVSETKSDVFYTCKFGYQYFEDLNVAIKIPYFNNHFLTRIESDTENLKTVMDIDHFYVEKSGVDVKNISDNPMWIEVIHKTNVDNDIKVTLSIKPVLRQMNFKDFGLNLNTAPFLSAVSIFATAFSVRMIRQVERRLTQKIRKKTIIAAEK